MRDDRETGAKSGGPAFADVYSFSSLLAAFHKARRAKRGRGGEPAFYWGLESNLLALSRELREGSYRPDPYRYFRLWGKKERVVSEASFRDRVVHHSLVAALEPAFEERFIERSFACRQKKGVHAAVKLGQRLARRWPFVLKLDVQSYFEAISHMVLLRLLAEVVEDQRVLGLCSLLMSEARVPGVGEGEARGLPIGNLTSQFWANVYLDPLDHYLLTRPGCGAALRYMDDLLVFGEDRRQLWTIRSEAARFVGDRLALRLKERATMVIPVTEGIPWLGFRLFPGMVRLDQAARRRFCRKLLASMTAAAAGAVAEAGQVPVAASLCGHVGHANTRRLRQSVLKRVEEQLDNG